MDIRVGSVVHYNDSKDKYVVTGIKNYEDYGSMSYDRYYYLLGLKFMEDKGFIEENEGIEVEVRGTTLPFTIAKDEAPFKITKEIRYRVERMKPKTITITIYE